MADDKSIVATSGALGRWSPGVVTLTLLALTLSILASAVVWKQLSERRHRETAVHFETHRAEIALRIDERFRGYRMLLRGSQALLSDSKDIDPRTLKNYLRWLRFEEDYAGIQGIGFTMWIEPVALESHVRAMRREGYENYQVWPTGPRDGYSSIIVLEPSDWRNQRAIGYDMYSEAVRREAMERAMRTGQGALSGKITLVQETTDDVQAGVLLYMPVFAQGMPVASEAERRAALRGWVYMPFRMSNLMRQMFVQHPDALRIQIFDQAEGPASMLYDSHPGRHDAASGLVSVEHITLAGRDWLVRIEALPGFAPEVDAKQAELVSIVLMGLLFVVATWFFSLTRERARILARTTDSLRRSEARYSALVNLAHDGIVATDTELRLTFVNPGFLQMVGGEESSLLGRPLDEMWSGDGQESHEQILARLQDGQGKRYEVEFVRGDGKRLTALVSDAPLNDGYGSMRGAIILLSDISERKEAERRIAHMASHDALTGVPNRLMFDRLLAHTLDQSRRYQHHFALLFVDLDHFKQVNDQLGHHVGDMLLIEAVKRMQGSIRSSDTLGRRGGDEFVVLLPETALRHDAEIVAEKIRTALEQEFILEGHQVQISSSIGIVLYPEHGTDGDTLLRRADEAMYRAKGGGRNRSHYCG
ncbi:CHASE domain-containing protein [Aromatoleum diolicum]|uniref:Diguanylate cyclase n=1 Tax=Aromatoleum diolicum TaxID=75796 RepID=A0ABX1Q9Q4_9RHOO|nr:CHASE domain-containing protein [Aromatoleum diolicum]NMG75111.1 diguanylate cyclase [Aromatoleum diolicum]